MFCSESLSKVLWFGLSSKTMGLAMHCPRTRRKAIKVRVFMVEWGQNGTRGVGVLRLLKYNDGETEEDLYEAMLATLSVTENILGRFLGALQQMKLDNSRWLITIQGGPTE